MPFCEQWQLSALSLALWFSFFVKDLQTLKWQCQNAEYFWCKAQFCTVLYFFFPSMFIYVSCLCFIFARTFRWRYFAASTSEYLYSFYQHETFLNVESCDCPGRNCEILCWVSGVNFWFLFCFSYVFFLLCSLNTNYNPTLLGFLQYCSAHKCRRSLMLQLC